MSRCGGGLIAEFDDAPALVSAVAALRAEGIGDIETYTPYPIDALGSILKDRPSRVPGVVLWAGLAGAAGGFLLQYAGMVFGYPLNIGGRPLDSWPAFLPSTYEIAVLSALLAGFLGFAIATGLSRLYEPVDEAPGFATASQDRFLLCLRGERSALNRERIAALLSRAPVCRVSEIPG